MTLLVFDSGIGGLGVVAQIRMLRPDVKLIYLADNACFPYGEQPDEFLIQRTTEVLDPAIAAIVPEAVVIACNTASTIALAGLRAAFAVPLIGCVPPVKPAAAASASRHIGLLATPATIRRRYLQELIDAHAQNCAVHSLGTPALAAFAEQKFWGGGVDLASLRAAVAPLFELPGAASIDAIALGCTHYTFLLPELQILYPDIRFFDPAPAVARQACKMAEGASARPSPQPDTAFFTAAPDAAAGAASRFAAFGFSQIKMLPDYYHLP